MTGFASPNMEIVLRSKGADNLLTEDRRRSTFRVHIVALGLMLCLGVASAQTSHICYDETDGGCEVNVFASDAMLASMGTFAVCSDHLLFNAPDSVSCSTTTPGVWLACVPASGGYCNATVVQWSAGIYQFDVSATGASAATLTMGGFGSGTYSKKIDGSLQGTFNASLTTDLSIVTGGTKRVAYETTAASSPGEQDGGAPPAIVAAGDSPSPVIVNVGAGAAAAGAAAGGSAPFGVKLAGLLIGLGLVLAGEAHILSPIIPSAVRARPRHMLAVAGVVLAGFSVMAMLPPPA